MVKENVYKILVTEMFDSQLEPGTQLFNLISAENSLKLQAHVKNRYTKKPTSRQS